MPMLLAEMYTFGHWHTKTSHKLTKSVFLMDGMSFLRWSTTCNRYCFCSSSLLMLVTKCCSTLTVRSDISLTIMTCQTNISVSWKPSSKFHCWNEFDSHSVPAHLRFQISISSLIRWNELALLGDLIWQLSANLFRNSLIVEFAAFDEPSADALHHIHDSKIEQRLHILLSSTIKGAQEQL